MQLENQTGRQRTRGRRAKRRLACSGCKIEEFRLVDEDGFASFHHQRFGAGGHHGLQGAYADGGHIETHVLPGFGELHDGESASPTQCAGAADAFVGPFDGFHSQASAIFHYDALTDIEATHFFGQLPAEFDIGLLRRVLAPAW